MRSDPQIDSMLREAELTHDRGRLARLAPELLDRLVAAGRPAEALRVAADLADRLPEHVPTLDRAARLLEEGGRTREAILARQRLDAALPPRERVPNLLRLGELLRRSGEPQQAEVALRRAAALAPRDPGPPGLLAGLLEAQGRIEEASSWLVRQAEVSRGPTRAACLLRAAELQERALGDPAGAARTLARLGDDLLSEPGLEARVEELLHRAGRLAELAERLAWRRNRLPDDDPAALELDLRRGGLLERLGRTAEAAAVWRSVLARRPDSPEARAGLDRALRASPHPEDRLERLEIALEDAAGDERGALLLERAALLEGELGRFEEAEAGYRELETEEGELGEEARRRLDALLERRGAVDELCERLAARLKDAAPREAVALLERLAALEEWGRRRPQAAAAHLEAALRLEPDRADLRRRLAALLHGSRRAADVARLLLDELEATPPPSPAREVELRAGVLLRRREAGIPAESVREHAARILELEPGHALATAVCLELLGSAAPAAERVALLEARLARLLREGEGAPPSEAAERLSLRVRLAGILWREAGDAARAIAHLEAARAEVGPVAVVAEPLADLYRSTGRIAPLLLLCREAATCSEAPEERALWWVRLGDELRRRGDEGPALEAFRRALVEQPGHPGAEAALRDLYRRRGDAEGLARALEAALTRAVGPGEVPLRVELAELLAGPLARPLEALQQLRRVLDIDPRNLPLLGRAIELARRLDRSEDLAELLDLGLRLAVEPAERARLLAERGRLRAAAGASEEAAHDLRRALELAPDLDAAREALAEIELSEGRTEEALELLADLRPDDPDAARSHRRRLADLAFERLPPERALPWLERAAAADPGDAEVRARIAETHRRAGRADTCVRWLREELALRRDPAERLLLQRRIAALLAELGRAVEAAGVLEAALDEHGEDPDLLLRLVRLREQAGQPRERAEALRRLLPTLPTERRAPVRRELARIRADDLRDPAGAAEELAAALRESPPGAGGRCELLRELAALRRRAGDAAGAAEAAEAELELLDADAAVFAERRFRLRCELAGLYREVLGRPDRAAHHLRAALDEAPPTFDVGEAEATLIEILEERDLPLELAARLEARIAGGRGGLREYTVLARLREQRLALPAAAAAAWREVLRFEPDHLEALRGLKRCARELDDVPETIRMIEAELAHPATRDPVRRAALYRELGTLCHERLGATTRATRAFAAALEADPSDLESLRRLEGILEAVEDWRGALELLRSELEVLGSREPARRFEIWLRVADLARLRCGDPEGALAALEAAAALGELPVPRLAERVELARELRDRRRLAGALRAWCDHPEVRVTAAALVELARALRELGDPAGAETRLRSALELDPGHLPALEELAALKRVSGDLRAAADLLERAAGRAPDLRAAACLQRAAELVEGPDPQRALALLRRARQLDPGAARAALREAHLALRLGEPGVAWRAARAALELDPEALGVGGDARARLARDAARAAQQCGDLEAARDLCLEALRAAPEDPAALELAGDLLAARGEHAEAARASEARLSAGRSGPPRAVDILRAARARAARGDLEGALSLLDDDAASGDAPREVIELRLDLYTRAGRLEEAERSACELAAAEPDPGARADRLAEAARLRAARGGDPVPLLEEALRADPRCARARLALGARLEARGELEAAAAVLIATDVPGPDPDPEADGLWEAGIRVLARLGRRREAADRCGALVERRPDRVDLALLRARLQREDGRFEEAARDLARFTAAAGGTPPAARARLLVELARLRAGPLADAAGAREAFRRALELDPGCEAAAEELADLLVDLPEHTGEALRRHLALLERCPTRPRSLRALHRIAVREGPPEAAVLAAELAAALVPPERELGRPTARRCRIVAALSLDDPLHEGLRRMANACAGEIAAALGVSHGLRRPETDAGGFLPCCVLAEQELCAPALVPLADSEFASVLGLVASLAWGSEAVRGDGRLVNALARTLGRRARRRARRCLADTSPEAVAAVDFSDLRHRLRGLAAAVALDRSGVSVASALDALCRIEVPAPDAAAALHRRDAVAHDPVASDLALRIARAVAREILAAREA